MLLRLFMASTLIAGCAAQRAETPLPPKIEAVGILAEAREAAPDRTYILEDGRRFDISTEITRVLFQGGIGDPFVLGSDPTGPFVAVFSNQDGLPPDCWIIPAGGAHGIERGIFIELDGVLWRKAPTFRPGQPVPRQGEEYPFGTAFCFNASAQVSATVPRP